MVTDADALLAAIVANPDEDDIRLRYADLLQEQGDDDRAEFIRVQCEIARHDITTEVCLCGYEPCDGYHHNSPNCPYVRSDELLEAHGREWCGGSKCGECEGHGRYARLDAGYMRRFNLRDWNGCDACGGSREVQGTGWACWPLVTDAIPGGVVPASATIASTFRRGFLHSIELTHEQFLGPGVAGVIGLWHPTVREVVLVGKEPFLHDDMRPLNPYWVWQWSERGDTGGELPQRLYSLLPVPNKWPTAALARAALSRACVQYLRDEAAKLVPA